MTEVPKFAVAVEEARVAVGEEDWVSIDDAEVGFEMVSSFAVVFAETTLPLTVVIADANSAETDVDSSVPVMLLLAIDDSVLCIVGRADMELLCFTVGATLC